MLGALGQEMGADCEMLDRLYVSLNPLSRFDFGLLASSPYAREWFSARWEPAVQKTGN